MKRLAALFAAAALAVSAGDPPKDPKKAPPPDEKKERLFSGTVVAGKLLQPGAEIAFGWSWTLDTAAFAAKDPIVADAKGAFSKSLAWKGERTVFAADAAHKLGVAVEFKEQDIAKPVVLRLAPLVRVKVPVTSREAGYATDGITVEVRLEGAGRIGTGHTGETGLDLLLPAGTVKLKFAQEGWQSCEVRITVPPGKPEFTAPAVQVTPSLLACRKGEVMPEWRIADAIGLPKDAKLAGFRGKWVLLWFWRDGCPSCRGWGVPNLVKFHDRHADWKDRLQIVAFHNRDAKSAAELREFLSKQQGLEWDPSALPFPIVIDVQEPSTVEEWGPGEFPYVVLLDPEGKLATTGTLEDVDRWLEQEFKGPK